MLHFIDALIRRHLVNEIPGLTVNDVGFGPPNDDWRQQLGLSDRLMLNVYLMDLRENRALRSNARARRVTGIEAAERRAPLRVDLHIAISAWSPAAPGQPIEPTIDEHELLGEVVAAFAEAEPLSFERVFAGIGLPPGLPASVAGEALPFQLLPVEGWPKLEEFWGTMGETAPTKPIVYLILTAPFVKAERPVGPIVTTLRVHYQTTAPGAAPETLHSIGGRVGDSAAPLPDGGPGPVAEAWVELLTSTGRRLALKRSDDEGRFIFERIPAGEYRIQVTVANLGSQLSDILVPSATAAYDVVF